MTYRICSEFRQHFPCTFSRWCNLNSGGARPARVPSVVNPEKRTIRERALIIWPDLCARVHVNVFVCVCVNFHAINFREKWHGGRSVGKWSPLFTRRFAWRPHISDDLSLPENGRVSATRKTAALCTDKPPPPGCFNSLSFERCERCQWSVESIKVRRRNFLDTRV